GPHAVPRGDQGAALPGGRCGHPVRVAAGAALYPRNLVRTGTQALRGPRGMAEDAPALQQLAEQSLLRLQSHTAGLDQIVRDEIRRCFIAECGALVEE